MKKLSTFLGCFLSCILLSCIAVFATEEVKPTLTIAEVTAGEEETIDVPVSISDNTGICGATFYISYDSALTLTAVKAGTAFANLVLTKPGDLSISPVALLWDGVEADTSNGEIVVLTFQKPEQDGVYEISVSYESGDIFDGDLNLVELNTVPGSIKVGSAEPHTHSGGTATCKSRAICTECGEEYGELDPSNHVGETEVRDAVPATCTDGGYSGDLYCLSCGEMIEQGHATEVIDHVVMIDPAVSPTTTQTGLTEGSHCSACGAVLVPQEVIPVIEEKERAEVSVDQVSAVARGDIIVPVRIAKNPGIAGFVFDVNYDNSILTLKEVTLGEVLTSGEVSTFENVVSWYTVSNITGDGILLNLVFEASDGVSEGISEVRVKLHDGKNKNFADEEGQSVASAFTAGSVTLLAGLPGDVDGDGDLTIADVVLLNRHVLGKITLENSMLQFADIDSDSDLTIADVVLLNRHVLGKIDLFADGEDAGENVDDHGADEANEAVEDYAADDVSEFVEYLAADSQPETANDDVVIEVGSAVTTGGATFDVPVTISGNPGIAGAALEVAVPEDYELNSITAGDVFSKGAFDTNGNAFNWYTSENVTENGTIVVLNLTADEDARTAKISIGLRDNKPNNLSNEDGQKVTAVFAAGTIKIPRDEDVENVVDLLNDLPAEAGLAYADQVKKARDAYDDLTDEQKASVPADLVTKLTTIEGRVAEEKAAADQAAADDVIALIEALPTTIQASDEEDISKAREAYDALTDDQKALISDALTAILESAEEEIAAILHVHDWTLSNVITEPTCTQTGEAEYTCSCGEKENREIPARGHSLEKIAAVAATCEADGSIAYWHCTVCEKNFLENDKYDTSELTAQQLVVPALGHTWGKGVITKTATRDEDGEKTFTCEVCQKTKTEAYSYTGDTVIPARAFADKDNLKDITIGASVTRIEDEAFAGCTSLKEIYFEGDMPELGKDVFKDIDPDAVIYYPEGNPTWTQKALQDAGIELRTASWNPKEGLNIIKDLADLTVKTEYQQITYDGTPKRPAVIVKDGQMTLQPGTDYTVSYGENVSAGTGTVKVTGLDNYKGTAQATFLIAKAKGKIILAAAAMTKKVTDPAFDLQITEVLTDGTVTFASSDPSVASIDPETGRVKILKAGTTNLMAMASGVNYTTEAAALTLTVKDPSASQKPSAVKKNNVITAADLTVRGTGIAQAVAVQASAQGKAKLSFASDTGAVKVSESGTLYVPAAFAGRVKVTITSAETEQYKKAAKTVSVIVLPKSMKLSKAKPSGSRKAKVTWEKNDTAQGYELQYATNKTFTKKMKTVSIKKQTTVKKTVKKLKGGKKYYFRIRAYVKIDETKYYSDWSKAKKVKIRK